MDLRLQVPMVIFYFFLLQVVTIAKILILKEQVDDIGLVPLNKVIPTLPTTYTFIQEITLCTIYAAIIEVTVVLFARFHVKKSKHNNKM